MIQIFVDNSTWGHWFSWQDGETFPTKPQFLEYAKAFNQIYNLVVSQPEKFIFLYNARIYHPKTGHAELPVKYFERFEYIVSMNFLKKVIVPCTRYDGHFMADGSIGYGGEFGGSLQELLSLHNNHEKTLKQHWPNPSGSEVFSEKTRFMIRDISFTKLRENGVPDEVLQAIQSLKDRLKKSKKKFLEALQEALTPILIDQYRDLILRYAFYDTQPRKEEYDVEHLESALEAKADFFLTDDEKLIGRVERAAKRYNTFAYQRAKEICMPPSKALTHIKRLC